MEDTRNDVQNQRHRTSKLAVASALLPILAFAGVGLADSFKGDALVKGLGILLFFISLLGGLAIGITALHRIKSAAGQLKGRLFAISGIATAAGLLVAVLIPHRPPYQVPYEHSCGANVSGLGKAMLLYASDHNDQYPSPTEWCDSLMKYADLSEKQFICKAASNRGDKGPCHYAMNPNCGPNSSQDMVLLFETKGGWNQHGGSELLALDNHNDNGCNVLFNGGYVEFVKAEDIGKLKWKADEPNNVQVEGTK